MVHSYIQSLLKQIYYSGYMNYCYLHYMCFILSHYTRDTFILCGGPEGQRKLDALYTFVIG